MLESTEICPRPFSQCHQNPTTWSCSWRHSCGTSILLLPIHTDGLQRQCKKINIKRSQLPLIASWVITDYKSQGATFSKAIIDLSKPPGRCEPARAYVALSRVKSLTGLYILRDFEFDVITTLAKPTVQMQAENARLHKLAISTELELCKKFPDIFQSFKVNNY